MGYIKLFQSELTQRLSQDLGSYAFNLSTRKVETGVLWLGGKSNIKSEEAGAHYSLSKQFKAAV